MKRSIFKFSIILCAALCASSARAATLYWSGNGTTFGGPGTWNTTVAHWGTSTSGPFTTIWNNANSDTPIIGNTSSQTGGSVVIGANLTIKNDLILNPANGGYTLDGSSTITFNVGSTVNVPDVTSYRPINCKYAGTITKTGLGRVSFNNSGSSATKYIMKEGIAQFSAANRYGTGADSPDFLTLDGGTLQFDFLQPWTQGKSMTITANGGTLDGTSALVITQDKPVASSGNGTLTVDTITLIFTSAANTFTNQLTFTGGKLQLGANDAIPGGNIVVLNGGDMDMAGFNQTLKNIVVRNASSALTGLGTLTVTNLIDLRANSGNLSTVMAGPAKATKTGTTTVTVTGFNTYTGGLTMSAGVFRVGSGQPFGTGPLTLTAGTVQGNSGTARTLSMPVLLNGDVTLGSPTNAANLTFQTGAWTNNANHTLTVDTVTVTINSVIKEDAPGRSLTKAGTGTLVLAGDNTYTGDTTVNGSGGTLEATGAGAIPGNVTVTAGAFKLSNASAMSPSANLTLATSPAAGAVNLNFTGTQTIGALYFGGTQKDQGIWGAIGSGAAHQHAAFTGTGLLLVTTGNNTPVAPPAKSQHTAKNTPSTFDKAKLLAGATDADPGDTLTITAASTPTLHGVTVVEADDVKYTPTTGYVGSDSYSYTIDDGHGGTATGTVNVTVDSDGFTPNVVSGPSYADGKFSVTFAGIPGVTYTVEYAEGSAAPPWYKLVNITAGNTPGSYGLIVVEDAVNESPSRYYRTVYPSY